MKSNWGILEYTGLYILSFVLDNPEYLSLAKYFIKTGLNIQVQEDGMQWETSPMYHNEVLMCMQEAVRISRIFKDDLFNKEELDLIRKMGRVDMLLKNPDHRQPMVGDSDDTDLRDMITQTAFLFMDGKCVVSVVDKKTMDFYGATPKDLDGIVNQLRIIKGVECAIFLYEIGTLEYKVSMRSCGVINVSKISAMFGGGGHTRAAGCTMNGTSHDVISNISEQIEKQFTNGEDA